MPVSLCAALVARACELLVPASLSVSAVSSVCCFTSSCTPGPFVRLAASAGLYVVFFAPGVSFRDSPGAPPRFPRFAALYVCLRLSAVPCPTPAGRLPAWPHRPSPVSGSLGPVGLLVHSSHLEGPSTVPHPHFLACLPSFLVARRLLLPALRSFPLLLLHLPRLLLLPLTVRASTFALVCVFVCGGRVTRSPSLSPVPSLHVPVPLFLMLSCCFPCWSGPPRSPAGALLDRFSHPVLPRLLRALVQLLSRPVRVCGCSFPSSRFSPLSSLALSVFFFFSTHPPLGRPSCIVLPFSLPSGTAVCVAPFSRGLASCSRRSLFAPRFFSLTFGFRSVPAIWIPRVLSPWVSLSLPVFHEPLRRLFFLLGLTSSGPRLTRFCVLGAVHRCSLHLSHRLLRLL